jgi:hypothetical protein
MLCIIKYSIGVLRDSWMRRATRAHVLGTGKTSKVYALLPVECSERNLRHYTLIVLYMNGGMVYQCKKHPTQAKSWLVSNPYMNIFAGYFTPSYFTGLIKSVQHAMQ